MTLTVGEKVKIALRRRGVTIAELAREIGTSRQNLSNKFSRDNFSEAEMKEIARALNCEFVITLRMLDSGDEI